MTSSGVSSPEQMRFRAPDRATFSATTLVHPLLREWDLYGWLHDPQFPPLEALNAARPADADFRFVAQTGELLADGLHYEMRIAERGEIATRANWHDLFNAIAWLRFPALKRALNTRQVVEIAIAGPKNRTRSQCALTHFDEAGVVVASDDEALLALWDAHDWHGLFWRERLAWRDGRIAVVVFGHALVEHALLPRQTLVGKSIVVGTRDVSNAVASVAAAIADGRILCDPQELRPLPLSGIPGWHPDSDVAAFYRDAPCFRPLRSGRCYPVPLSV